LRLGDVLVELAVDAEAADLAQPVAVGVLELLAEQLLGLLQLRRADRPSALVGPQQLPLLRVGLVPGQRGVERAVVRRRPHRDLRGARGHWSATRSTFTAVRASPVAR